MKDIYELLNYVEIDNEEIPENDVSEIEKEKVKRNLNKHLRKRKYKKSGLIAAAICCAFIGGIGTIGIINPAYASDIPIIGDIFRYIDNGRTGVFDKYKENSNEINVVKKSHGVSLMIKDIVFDGTVISYTYEVKTDKDLGEYVSFHPETKNIFTMINGKYSGSCYSKCKKVSDNNYLGRAQITIERVENLEKVDLELMFNSVTGYDENHKKVDDIKGEWNFNKK